MEYAVLYREHSEIKYIVVKAISTSEARELAAKKIPGAEIGPAILKKAGICPLCGRPEDKKRVYSEPEEGQNRNNQ